MTSLSAVIISFNEENFIGRCLESLEGIADEIIVVDSFSTDSTEAVCLSKGVKFFSRKFEGYVEQKNYALTLATNDLVLSLDADEAVSPEMKASVLLIKENPEFDGYYFNRFNNYCGKWIKYSRWYPDRHLRLFDRRKGRWTGPNPHDKFRLNDDGRLKWVKGDILHWNYSSFEDHLEKVNRFSTISAESLFSQRRKSGPFTGLLHMSWSFFRSYIICGGFIDGYLGFMGCAITSWGSFLKYSKLRILNKEKQSKNGLDRRH